MRPRTPAKPQEDRTQRLSRAIAFSNGSQHGKFRTGTRGELVPCNSGLTGTRRESAADTRQKTRRLPRVACSENGTGRGRQMQTDLQRSHGEGGLSTCAGCESPHPCSESPAHGPHWLLCALALFTSFLTAITAG